MWILYVLIGLVALWILVSIVRALTRPQSPPNYGQPGPPAGYGPGQGYPPGSPGYGQPPMGGYGGGGGGFWSNMLGGMFGAAAGNWIYDSMFRGSGGGMGSAYGPDHRHMENQPFPPSYPADTGIPGGSGGDFERQPQDDSGAGGDFGDNDQGGAGADFGNDDSATGTGGDFGDAGGDFGGGEGSGGDFSGGDSGGGDAGGGDF